ncbi:MAG TPA: hypothetical protein VK498_05675 [Ferruginibacter sp.]|nr:hypothetical protein [Ferruginibacter sp.]
MPTNKQFVEFNDINLQAFFEQTGMKGQDFPDQYRSWAQLNLLVEILKSLRKIEVKFEADS